MKYWYPRPEVDDMYFSKTVDYDTAYHHLYGGVAFMLCNIEDEKVKKELLREWDRLRWNMPQ